MCVLAAGPGFAAEERGFKTGAAKIEITPSIELGLLMSGYAGRDTPAEGLLSCETVVTRVKPGCAEAAISDTLVEMMDAF